MAQTPYVPIPFPVRKGFTLDRMVTLAGDPVFNRACQAYTLDLMEALLRLGKSGRHRNEWRAEWEDIQRQSLLVFATRWGVLPKLEHTIVALATATVHDGRWGVIPIFPWTSEQEVVSRLRAIKKAIGSHQKDTWSTLTRNKLLQWIRAHCRHSGKPWTWPEVGAAVLGEARLSCREEQRLMREYIKGGFSYQEAERKILRRFYQGSQQGETAKKAVQRLEAALEECLPDSPRPQWADPLAPRLAELVAHADKADLETLRAKVKAIGTLLLQLAHPKPEAGT